MQERVIVGPRAGVLLWFLFFVGVPAVTALVAPDQIAGPGAGALQFVLTPIAVVVAALVALQAVKPCSIRLGESGFTLWTPWGGWRRVRWEDSEPPFLVTRRGRGGRTFQVVAYAYRPGRRPADLRLSLAEAFGGPTLPMTFPMEPLSLLVLMNEYRAQIPTRSAD